MVLIQRAISHLLLITLLIAYAKGNATETQASGVKKSNLQFFPFNAAVRHDDYDENYYKDITVGSDLQNHSLNETKDPLFDGEDNSLNFTSAFLMDDDEDSTNGDYIDELGSTTDDIFQSFNSDPHFEVHLNQNKTLEGPKIIQQNENAQIEPAVTEIFKFFNAVPNYSNDTLPKCPNGLNSYQNEAGTTFCFLELEASAYPPQCPYANHLESYALPTKIIGNKTIWATPIFKLFDSFGAEFVTNNWNNTGTKNCAKFEQSKVTSASCNSRFESICAYSNEKQYSFDDYCKSRYNDSCSSADLGSGQRCYCLVKAEVNDQRRNSFCRKLAEPLEPYQNALLLKTISGSDKCWMGFYQDADGTANWSSSRTQTNYTYWSFTTEFSKTYGAISEAAWSLEDDGTLNCAVCEIYAVEHPSVSLRIKHNRITNKIQLRANNAVEIFNGIDCYSYGVETHIDLEKNHLHYLEIDVFDVNDIPRYYWCKAFQVPHLTPVYSNRILAQNIASNNGHEYAISNNPEIPSSPYFMTQLIFNETYNVLYHIHTVPSNYSIQEEMEFISKFVSSEITSSEVCLPSVTHSNKVTLSWPQTPIGSTVLPANPCLQSNGWPVTRKCAGNFLYGATWSGTNGTCYQTVNLNVPQLYHNLMHFNNRSSITLTLLEVHRLGEFLIELNNTNEFINALDALMNYPKHILKTSQNILNTTDSLLDSLQKRINKIKTDDLNNSKFSNLVIDIGDLTSERIGLKLTSNGTTVKVIYNETQLVLEDFDIVLSIPKRLYQEIANCSGLPNPKLVFVVFRNYTFFGEAHTASHIFSIIIPNSLMCTLSSNIEILFGTKLTHENLKCGSWTYGSNDLMEHIYGYWETEQEPRKFGAYEMCEYQLGSYYALVENEPTPVNDKDREVLFILGVVVGFASALSVAGVLITAFVFKSCTYNHIAVISISISAAIQLILTFFVILFKIQGVGCLLTAVTLHYTALTQFLWMLVIAWQQHSLYLIPTVYKQKRTLKTCLIVRAIPLILVVVMALSSSSNYGVTTLDVCYATGNNFIYALLLPVSIILPVILIIFGKTLMNLRFSKTIKTHHLVNETSFSQLKLAITLFLLLGITWGLGILTLIMDRKIIPYLYSIFACFQEIVIFLFFIVLNDKTRPLWVNVKSVCCMGQSKGYELTRYRKGGKKKFATSHF